MITEKDYEGTVSGHGFLVLKDLKEIFASWKIYIFVSKKSYTFLLGPSLGNSKFLLSGENGQLLRIIFLYFSFHASCLPGSGFASGSILIQLNPDQKHTDGNTSFLFSYWSIFFSVNPYCTRGKIRQNEHITCGFTAAFSGSLAVLEKT